MLKLYPLYSGSSGNMYLIKSPKSTIIVDIGVSFKSMCTAIDNLGLKLDDISALLITHEHTDHTQGLSTFINKTNIPIYSTKGTLEYLLDKYSSKLKRMPTTFSVTPETSFNLEDITITPFRTSHDAVDPVGYTFKNEDSILTIATDLGVVNDNVYDHLKNSKFSVLECNYDRNLLLMGPYTYPLKCRIQSDIGHLSNEDTACTILNLARDGKRDFLLGHISKNNNEPEEALFKVQNTLTSNGYNLDEFNISVATRDLSFEVYDL